MHLIVITGAGASFDCASVRAHRTGKQPPLAKDLFHTDFEPILRQYPLALAAAADIAAETVGSPDAPSIENFLREKLKESYFPEARRRYLAIPLYLQHLLLDRSQGYTDNPDNYFRLVNAAIDAVDRVEFLTLNYDLLLERALTPIERPTEMDWYVRPGRSWSLHKLHGSVNWARKIANPEEIGLSPNVTVRVDAFVGDDLVLVEKMTLSEEITYQAGHSLMELRAIRKTTSTEYHYPALSAPLGSRDEIVSPRTHVEALKRELGKLDALNLLVIGYSGHDDAVRALLRDSGKPIARLSVVSGTLESAEATAARLQDELGAAGSLSYYTDGFTGFAQQPNLRELLAALAA